MPFFLTPLLTTAVSGIIGAIGLKIASLHYGNQNRNEGQHNIDQNQSRNQNCGQLEQLQINSLTKNNKNDQNNEKSKEETGGKKKSQSDENSYVCFLTGKVIQNPAQLMCGHCFELSALVEYLKKNKKCPKCERKARFSEILQSPELAETINKHENRKRARKMSHQRLIQDFGDDQIDFHPRVCENQKAHSDTQCSSLPHHDRKSEYEFI